MNKARITYRFGNGRSDSAQTAKQQTPREVIPLTEEEFSVVQERDVKSVNHIVDTQPLNQFTTDFGAWNSPFDAETQRVERIIRESDRSVERKPFEQKNELFRDTYNPDTGYFDTTREEHSETYDPWPRVTSPRYVRHPGTPWFKVMISVVGAVATGAVFGFFVLSMFSSDDGSVKTTADNLLQLPSMAVSQNKSSDSVTPKDGSDSSQIVPVSSAVSANASAITVQIPAKTYSLLQHGVFSNQQGADMAQADLRKQGLAAVTDATDKIYVYVGMTQNRNDALALSHQLQEMKKDVFIKSHTVPAVQKMLWNGKENETASRYFTQGSKLVQVISGLTLVHLQEEKPGAFEQSSLQSVRTTHQQWNGAATTIGEHIPQGQKATLQKMNTAMNTAVLSLEEYSKNPSASYLWQAQTALITYVLAEKELLKAISVQ